MAEEQILNTFVQLHAHKLKSIKTLEPIVFLAKHTPQAGIPLHAVLEPYSLSEVLSDDLQFDKSNTTVHWLIWQLQSYDYTRQKLLGVKFENDNIFAHVIVQS